MSQPDAFEANQIMKVSSRLQPMTLAALALRRWLILSAAALSLWTPAPPAEGAIRVTTLVSFAGTNGAQPACGLVLGTDGNFYGTTSLGGASGDGTVFMLTPVGVLSTLLSFDGTNGAQPLAGLVQGTNGSFYGATSAGGAYGLGTIFTTTPAGALTTLFSFDGTNGARPLAGLVQAMDGNFYGMTSAGGAYNHGTIFAATPAGAFGLLFSFDGTNGANPAGGLVQGADRNLYGTTAAGGTVYNSGTVFKIITNPTNRAFLRLFAFAATNGAAPQAALVQGTDGTFYGTTAGGGTNGVAGGGDGTLFNMTAAGALTTLLQFSGTNGANPFAPLVQGLDGNFYGTTAAGGAHNRGSVFKLSPAGTLTTLYSFTGGSDGAQPVGALAPGTNGNFYGTTSAGGAGGSGTIFLLSGFSPFIITQPTNQTIASGTTATLVVRAGGSAPLTYQWLRNSNILSDRGQISGAATPVLTISNTTTNNSGTYSVIVKNAAGSVASTGAVLTVVNPYGAGGPTVSITSPAQNAFLLRSLITATGKAGGSATVARVYYQLNGTGWLLATPSGAGWANWTANLILPPGTNVLQAFAVNIAGAVSPTNSVSFVCGITSAPVVVQINGSGTLTPNYNGQWLQVGRTYIVTAVPGPGYLFSDWTSPLVTNTTRISFVMQSNLVLQANFVPNPFVPVAGVYYGLFYDTNRVAQPNSGAFTVATTARATFSGSLHIGAARSSVSGRFDTNGTAQATIPRPSLNPLTVHLQLDLTQGTGRITGTVSDGTWTAQLAGDRYVFNGVTNIPPQTGRYAMMIPGNADSAASPGGTSYGTIAVDTAGRIHLAGALADGTRISQTVPVSHYGQWPLYVPLYGGQGSVFSWLTFATNAPGPDLSGNLTWIKPAIANARYYPGGFTNNAPAMGSRYSTPGGGTNVLGLTNAEVVLLGGNLAQSITNLITVDANSHVTSSNKLSLAFSLSTGSFSGTTVDPTTLKPIPFSGVVLQDQALGSGFFLGTNQGGAVLLQGR